VFSVERRVGRLLEIRIGGAATVEDVVGFGQRYRELSAAHDGLFLACSDARAARLLPPEVSELLLSFMRTRKTKIEYNAFIIGESSLVGLQTDRLIKGASHPGRQVVRTVAEAIAFLDPFASVEERRRLRQFLDASVP
jgi:hypothetical protein